MADPISIISLASAAIGPTIKFIAYLQTVKSAKTDRSDWEDTLGETQNYFEELKARLDGPKLDITKPWFQKFLKVMGYDKLILKDPNSIEPREPPDPRSPFGCLKKKLQELSALTEPKSDRLHRVMARALHPRTKKNVVGILDDIERLRKKIMDNVQLEHLALSEATYDEVSHLQQTVDRQQDRIEMEKALDRVSKLDFVDRQISIYDSCFQDGKPPAQWFLTSEEFAAWRAGQSWPLYCHGQPGAGKVGQ